MRKGRTLDEYAAIAERMAQDPKFLDHVLDLEQQSAVMVDARAVLVVVFVAAILGGLLGVWLGSS